MDYNSELDQVAVNSVQGELYVIDHGSTFTPGDPQASIAKAAGPAGDSLYRFGDPARYAQGDPPRVLENWDNATSGHKQMGGALDVQWINPFLDANGRDTGNYVNPPHAGYRREEYDRDTHNSPRQISRQVAWSYRSINNHGVSSAKSVAADSGCPTETRWSARPSNPGFVISGGRLAMGTETLGNISINLRPRVHITQSPRILEGPDKHRKGLWRSMLCKSLYPY